MKNVSIYTTVTCKYCNLAKDFFKKNNVAYNEYNVGADREKLQEMMDKSGQRGVPVITVDEEVIVGFDEDRLRELLVAA
ncbi:NrdH-redoxin [Patescibacteria group bacterium]|nr:NrdH-redoxin [Patescibacteria group bacterium]